MASKMDDSTNVPFMKITNVDPDDDEITNENAALPPIEHQIWQQPGYPVVQQPGYPVVQQPGYPVAVIIQDGADKPRSFFCFALFVTCCCCPIFGVCAAKAAYDADIAFYKGDYEAYKRKSKGALWGCILTLVAGIIVITLYILRQMAIISIS